MELITGFSNPPRLAALNSAAMLSSESVDAAVAYVSDERTLIDACMRNRVKLTLWARYDFSMPVSDAVIERFLHSPSLEFSLRVVPDIFHPKVIWWHGFGAYIGSANLTQRAWTGGIEAGLFLTDEELAVYALDDELTTFFQQVDERSYRVNQQFLEHARALEKAMDAYYREEANARKVFEESRKALGISPLNSLFDITHVPSKDRRQTEFLKEWNATITLLRGIANRVTAYRPAWIAESVPAGAQADQFLHAFYYNQVARGRSAGFQHLYLENHKRIDAAVAEALTWWQGLQTAPTNEDEMLATRLPRLQHLLQKHRLPSLTREEFSEVCTLVHAIYNHGRQVNFSSLGLAEPEDPVPARERVLTFGAWLYDQRSANGRSAIDSIYDVLYGGPDNEIPQRIFESAFRPENRVPRLGVSSLGEIVGWVRPDFSPPRNNRTNKALRALGCDVKVYGES